MPRRTVFQIDGQRKEFGGRLGWALEKLIESGLSGVTTSQLPPGIRWSSYILQLRKRGISIAMVREKHKGEFPGQHGKYLLQCHAEIVRER